MVDNCIVERLMYIGKLVVCGVVGGMALYGEVGFDVDVG